MSERWERAIQEWYEKSHTADLEYLDLASKQKVSNLELAHNLSVIWDRICLSSRVNIKNYKNILENLKNISAQLDLLERKVERIQKNQRDFRPLTQAEVTTLVSEIASQPKKVEEQALQISRDLEEKLKRIEAAVEKLQHMIHE